MIEYIIVIVLVIVIFQLYFKITSPFWSHQPVTHRHQLFRRLTSPTVIDEELYVPKFMNLLNITTEEFNQDEEVNQEEEFNQFICTHYLKNNTIWFNPSFEKHILPYFRHDTNSYISYYRKEGVLLGVVTNRILRIQLCGKKFAVSYMDLMCVHQDHRRKLIAPELIQTHEYIQRTKSDKKCKISLFKKEGKLHDFIPLIEFDIKTYNRKIIKQIIDFPYKLPDHVSCIKIINNSFQDMLAFLTKCSDKYDCFIVPLLETLIELMEQNTIYIYALIEREQIIAAYFFRENATYMNSSKQNLDCFASLNNSPNINTFILGFNVAIGKIMSKFNMLQLENIGDNNYIYEDLERRNISPTYNIQSAYYIYNYSSNSIDITKAFILN